MVEHYYEKHPRVQSEKQTFTTTLSGRRFTFTSDRGVFSKASVDLGSRLLIEKFIDPQVTGDILDVGCGYGPIGVALSSITGRNVLFTDINERAVELARMNAIENGLPSAEVFAGNLFENIPQECRFGIIVSNPPIRAGKKVVHQLFEDAVSYLVPNGELWIVIQKKQGAPSGKRKLQTLFAEVVEVEKHKGYSLFRARTGNEDF